MRQHNLKPIADLTELRQSKSDIFGDSKLNFDYALPQGWLNAFADYCKANNHDTTYDMIRSCTVWAFGTDQYCGPVTCCSEVYDSWLLWELEQ